MHEADLYLRNAGYEVQSMTIREAVAAEAEVSVVEAEVASSLFLRSHYSHK